MSESIPGCYQNYGKPTMPNHCQNCLSAEECKKAKDATPIIKCLPRPDFPSGLMFYCPWCQKWHLHGKGEGYRAPHCKNPNSPLSKRDYYIKMASKHELREICKAITQYLERKK